MPSMKRTLSRHKALTLEGTRTNLYFRLPKDNYRRCLNWMQLHDDNEAWCLSISKTLPSRPYVLYLGQVVKVLGSLPGE